MHQIQPFYRALGAALLLLGLFACGGSTPVGKSNPGHSGGTDGAAADDYALPEPQVMPAQGRSVPDAKPATDFAAQNAAGLASLGSPAVLLAQLQAVPGAPAGAHGASFTQAEGHKDGAEYATLLPNNRVTIGGTALGFDPDFGPGDTFSGLAYAIWDFTLPDTQTGLLGSFNWGVDPALGNLYLGLGNFDDNRWDWVIPTEIVSLNLASCAPYIDNATDRFLLVVAITGSASASLTEIQLEGVTPPIVNLDADVASGLIPLDVDFDGSTSFDPDGSILSWEWDFDGDGSFGEPGVESANADVANPAPVTYSTAGSFDATLRLTDDDGASAQSVLTITTNIAPTVQLNADVTVGDAPLEVNFTATPADANGSIVAIEWDLDGNGSFSDLPAELAASGDATPPPYTYDSPGSFNIAVRVFDDHSAMASDVLNIQVGSPPQVNLSADLTSGPKPLTVTFSADASDPGGSIDLIEWDFDGDGNYNEGGNGELAAQNDPTPTKTYSTTGNRNATVRVTDNDGGTASDSLLIQVSNTPPLADLAANPGTDGDAPFDVFFDASGSSDPGGSVQDYEWDFDGDGVYNEEATAEQDSRGNPLPDAITYFPGVTTVRVRVTDDDGATDIASLDITAHGWVVTTIDNGDSAIACSIASIGGHPAVCWRDGATTGLRYAYSSTVDGTDPADWTLVNVDATANSGWASHLLEVQGAPAIASHNQSNGNLRFHRANTATGDTEASWSGGTNVLIDNSGTSGWLGLSMAIIAGNPAIAYLDADAKSLGYARAADAAGTDWSGSGSSLLTVDAGGGTTSKGEACSLAVISGNPAIAYRYGDEDMGVYQTMYCRSSTSTGADAGDWATKTIVAAEDGNYYSLAEVGGNPAIGYKDMLQFDLRYRRAGNSTGSLATDWSGAGSSSLTLESTGLVGSYSRLAIVGGNPALIHRDDASTKVIRYLRASNSTGASLSDWTSGIAETADSGENALGEHMKFAVVAGRPCIAYRGAASTGVVYATRY